MIQYSHDSFGISLNNLRRVISTLKTLKGFISFSKYWPPYCTYYNILFMIHHLGGKTFFKCFWTNFKFHSLGQENSDLNHFYDLLSFCNSVGAIQKNICKKRFFCLSTDLICFYDWGGLDPTCWASSAADLFDCRLGFALNLVATYLCASSWGHLVKKRMARENVHKSNKM